MIKHIGIIGGGVSSLAAAYYLKEVDPSVEITIYEAKEQLGGNAESVEVKLGKWLEHDGKDYIRWSDLGVNDFNKTTYKKLVAAMDHIGFHDYSLLEDSIAYFTLDNSIVMVDDTDLKHGISDSLLQIDPKLKTAQNNFMKQAVGDVIKSKNPVSDKRWVYWATVEEYFDRYERCQCPPEDRKFMQQLRHHIIYPRISAMYFTDERKPQILPIRSVMEYYMLQEGYDESDNPPKPQRMYFKGGSQKWINKLAKWLKEIKEVNFKRNFKAKLDVKDNGVDIYNIAKYSDDDRDPPEHADAVIISTHADDAIRSFGENLDPRVASVLCKISYTNSIAVCHTYAGLLPQNRNAWRTYNVLIHSGVALSPYTMTYVCNRHQNDPANPKYCGPTLPQYFVTLNPIVSIPEEQVLEVEKHEGRIESGYQNLFDFESHREKAITYFKHNVLDFGCLEAQEFARKLYDDGGIQGGPKKNVYFVGGWTSGAGLHEQCWEMGELITKFVLQKDSLKIAEYGAVPLCGKEYYAWDQLSLQHRE